MRPFNSAVLAAMLGLLAFGIDSSCSSTPRCLASNCAGCCDVNGECQTGNTPVACGARALLCVQCSMTEACVNAGCVPRSGDGGPFLGDGGVCNAATCNGCCDTAGNCRSGNTNSGCGTGGTDCATCPSGQSCQMNACAPFTCTGCVNGAGTCLLGTNAGACGSNGAVCATCSTGQNCTGGACVAGGTCTPANCSGCCDGTNCVLATTDARCGSGGANCASCTAPYVCASGACSAGVPDAGPGGPCGPSTCSGCCDSFSGACQPGDQTAACGAFGDACKACGVVCVFGLGCI